LDHWRLEHHQGQAEEQKWAKLTDDDLKFVEANFLMNCLAGSGQPVKL